MIELCNRHKVYRRQPQRVPPPVFRMLELPPLHAGASAVHGRETSGRHGGRHGGRHRPNARAQGGPAGGARRGRQAVGALAVPACRPAEPAGGSCRYRAVRDELPRKAHPAGCEDEPQGLPGALQPYREPVHPVADGERGGHCRRVYGQRDGRPRKR